MNRAIVFLLLGFQVFASAGWALPKRLVIAIDGISYRDVKALQEGIPQTNLVGGVSYLRAFTLDEGYFPVSRMVSTFPSTSDVAWTDIFGNRPLAGYQRTYYSVAANSEIFINGLTSTVEHERQMDWQAQNNFVRSMGYLSSIHAYEYELHALSRDFFNKNDTNENYYIYIRSSDDAQHMDRNILSMLVMLDNVLQDMRARYKATEGHDLQILIISDHGHNHAGRGERIQVRSYLEDAGYRITESIQNSNDVVLPTAGIEDWIEIHNAPTETEKLADLLTHLQGADIVTARFPDWTNCFLVLNTNGDRAVIQWNPAKNSFKYSAEKGDPLNYLPVVASLSKKNLLDADGFATADDWMKATMTNHYPVALQRIVRGHTSVTLNPATILVSLDNRYVHAGWLVNEGSKLVNCGSTHGALDDINSLGIILSNFTPTHDDPTYEVAGQFGDFQGLRKYRSVENGAEWVCKNEQSRTRIARDSFDWNYKELPDNKVFLRVWSPQLEGLSKGASLEATIGKVTMDDPQNGNMQPMIAHEQRVTFGQSISFSKKSSYESVYACPTNLALKPYSVYQISGWIHDGNKNINLFEFNFNTDGRGQPAPY
jgi:Type I phosphodiesterase / nucleotide pyrophosphatase